MKKPEIAVVIRTAHAIDPSSIHKKSTDGVTPTHLAASGCNLYALRTLLDLDVSMDLRDANNWFDTTPLEALNESMRRTRWFSETMSLRWNGYSENELTCQYLLKKAMGVVGLSSSQSEYTAQYRLGCTCGQCNDGWLSDRMRFILSGKTIFSCAFFSYIDSIPIRLQ